MTVDLILRDIRQCRTILYLSQQNVADYLNISQSSYAKLESGQSRLTVTHLLQISEYCNVSPLLLLTGRKIVFMANEHKVKTLLDELTDS